MSTSTANKQAKGLTDEERAAMKERAREQKAEAGKSNGEKAVFLNTF
jgi:hypothetical protein